MISLRHVSYRYPGAEMEALCDVTVDFPDGSFTAIMGSNGSGKSTLARCLNGLLIPSSGEVLVDSLATRDTNRLHEIRRKVGFVFQDPNLQMTSATVERELAFGLQNIGLPRNQILGLVERELVRLNLTARKDVAPSLLSGGEKIRLALAATLLMNPTHLVLDEPTSFLSPTSRKELMKELLELREKKGTTIIFITQFLSEALSTDRVIILDAARIVSQSPPAEAAKNAGMLASFGIFVPRNLYPVA